ncbi:MarR family transcriptional regulator [Streptomyces sp. SL13]|uniref:MarR family transcriptional regulator n=1 Tax=Streptantibioticus silvisoli TaxID=2705255 RepID=A0AA90KAD6_9ACTN|nr:MarR family transcriptional regulator [Streptantibioticus silvisoli]MDI5967643.1 MarR family transcriptional regulator [Streptantibioticus silvisoli]MDI5971982.1 MarR family transcriptional regulator [Streptantibioticus silvisoli]
MTDRSARAVESVADPAMTARLRLAIARLNRQMVRASSGQDLTFAQLSALSRVEQFGPLRLGELAARERVAASSMTRTITPLTAAGLIGKAPDPQDGRSFLIEITAHGAQVVTDIRRERSKVLADRVDRLTPEQTTALYAALPVLEALADDPEESTG